MKVKYFIGIVLVLSTVVLTILVSGGGLLVFVDIPTYVVIVLIPAAIAFATWPVREIVRAFTAPFDSTAGKVELEKASLFFGLLRHWIMIAAFIGTMIGLVCILTYADGHNLSKLGRNLGVMMLCITNALLLMILLPLPFESMAKRRLVGADFASESEMQSE